MKKLTALALAALLCLTLFAACAQPASEATTTVSPTTAPDTATTTQAATESGKLIVGLDDTFAPMGFRNETNNLIGFDIDLANAVGQELGVEIVFQPIAWSAKEMELDSKRIDCIWNGMSKTPERDESMTLSKPYLNNKIIIMTTPDAVVNTLEDLANYNVGTQQESAALSMLMADPIYETIKDSVTEYPTYDECILDMQSGRIQVMVVDEVLGLYKNEQMNDAFVVAPVDFGEDLYVIGFRKADTDLCAEVENALQTLIDNGKAAEISNTWFGKDIVLSLK